ncbi:putative pathogenesis associated protein Cap20 [Tothia fuscella]|uniref:Pathogenesis associated protein Cap20 n=1 Tax=Tothia fuscella TaxID=1048955 RepID=A0A9P4TTW6_9PEZI|nr:putative pathogenesis associated protein Cap20 [Tothia fuscella]
MPHAEDKPADFPTTFDNMTERLTNGEKANSQFLGHLTSYPVVSDTIGFYKTNPYGAKSLDVASNVYESLFLPIQQYFRGPYSYVEPYVAKADSLGASGLDTIDSKFPIVKEDTATLKGKISDIALFPLVLAVQSKDYLFETYSAQRKGTKAEQGGIISKAIAEAKAVFFTEYKIGSDAIGVLSSFGSEKKEEGKKFADSKLNN